MTRKGRPFYRLRNYDGVRGMSPWYDTVDWISGYPFEVASLDRIHEFLIAKDFTQKRIKLVGDGHGCNEYVYRKDSSQM